MKAHLERADTAAEHYHVRVFEEPIGSIDPETNQPWKPYEMFCVLSVRGHQAEIVGVTGITTAAFLAIRKAVQQELPQVAELYGWRWDGEIKRRASTRIKQPA